MDCRELTYKELTYKELLDKLAQKNAESLALKGELEATKAAADELILALRQKCPHPERLDARFPICKLCYAHILHQ
jgi:hypothetical protein